MLLGVEPEEDVEDLIKTADERKKHLKKVAAMREAQFDEAIRVVE